MLRSGVQLHSGGENAGFLSASISSDEMKLDYVNVNHLSRPLKKKKNRGKNRNGKHVGVEESSGEKPPITQVKKSMKIKSEGSDNHAVGAGRKIVQGRRRLQRQENVVPPENKAPSPKNKQLKKSQQLNIDKSLESPTIKVKISPPKKPLQRFPQRSMAKLPKDENKENEISLVDLAPSKLPHVKKHLKQAVDNLLETSVQKYVKQSPEEKKINLFDESQDVSFYEDSLDIIPISTISSKKLRNSSQSVTQDNTFEISLLSSSEISKRAKKRSTFEVKTDNLVAPNAYEHNLPEALIERVTEKQEKKKDQTFEIMPGVDDDELRDRRATFDINANGILPKSEKRRTYELKSQQIKTPEMKQIIKVRNTVGAKVSKTMRRESLKREAKKTSSTLVVRKTLNTPTSAQNRRLNSQMKDLQKIKISASKSSLSESGLSSPSILLRRARVLNPPSLETSTPNTTIFKAPSPKKKTPERSVSKVKKVPNYAAIHQNAYRKMESVDEHLQRKVERAKALLSGNKAPVAVKRTPVESKTKKQLFTLSTDTKPFNFANKSVNSPQSLKMSQRRFGAGDASILEPAEKAIKKNVGFNAPTSTKVPISFPATPKPTKQEVLDAYGTKIPQRMPATQSFTSAANLLNFPSTMPPTVAAKTSRKAHRLKEVASVSTKSKASTTSVESRRNLIKGVRSNRRFDLLMSMRK